MFSAVYKDGRWSDLEILPFSDLQLSPATSALHYGQSVFEGMKAYKNSSEEILLFRPRDHAERINISLERLCMPHIPEDIFLQGLTALLKIDKDWVPSLPNTSLYLRPFVFATDAYIGVRPSETYRFLIFGSPAGLYYQEPIKVKIETEYARAMKGGTGFAKAGGNYAGAMLPTLKAQQEGYQQLLWTDSATHTYFEESGTMNLMFIIDNILITPIAENTILKGITRDSIIQLAKKNLYKIEERNISIVEVIRAIENGSLQEAFGSGTAATVTSIKTIGHNGKDYVLPTVTTESFASKIAKDLDMIKRGESADPFNWIQKVI